MNLVPGDRGTVTILLDHLTLAYPDVLELVARRVYAEAKQPVFVTEVEREYATHLRADRLRIHITAAGWASWAALRTADEVVKDIVRQLREIVQSGTQGISVQGTTIMTPPPRPNPRPARPPVYGTYQPEPPNSVTYSPYPVLGFRAWHYGSTGLRGRNQQPWKQPWMQAICSPGNTVMEKHAAPEWDCNCGIYAHKTYRAAAYEGPVLGLVAMRNVIEHETGYRAGQVWVLTLERGGAWPWEWQRQLPFWAVVEYSRRIDRVADYYGHHPDEIPGPPDGLVAYPDEQRQAQWEETALIEGADPRDRKEDPWAR